MLKLLQTRKSVTPNPQIFDLLQLSRREADYKLKCLQVIRRLDAWKKMQGKAQSLPEKINEHVEGALLRRAAQEATLAYKRARAERIHLFHLYTDQLPKAHRLLKTAS